MARPCSHPSVENKTKYAKAPSWETIDSLVKEMGMSYCQFERFYGLPYNHLACVKCGQQKLASAYWHIFYERIKPTYGMGFAEDFYKIDPNDKVFKFNENYRSGIKETKLQKKKKKKEVKQKFTHDRLNDLS